MLESRSFFYSLLWCASHHNLLQTCCNPFPIRLCILVWFSSALRESGPKLHFYFFYKCSYWFNSSISCDDRNQRTNKKPTWGWFNTSQESVLH